MGGHRLLAVFAAVSLLAVGLPLLGCSESGGETAEQAPVPTETTLQLSGSATAMPAVRALTDAYPEETVEFRYLPPMHSGEGIAGVDGGTLDIGMISRRLHEDESALGLEETWLADDGLVVAVDEGVDVTGLSSQEIRDIYAGVHTDWSEVGGAALPIVVLDRAEDESAKITLREHLLQDVEVTDIAAVLGAEADMVEAVQFTEGAIGYFSLGLATSRGMSVRLLAVDGVEPSVDSIMDGTYSMVRPMGVVTEREDPAVREFLEWATGPEGRATLERAGFAPYQE
jgi:phosphate transport system substrate-binding protein